MQAELLISSLSTNGETTKVTASADVKGEAEWRNGHTWTLEVPEYVARRYRLGQTLRVTVRSC